MEGQRPHVADAQPVSPVQIRSFPTGPRQEARGERASPFTAIYIQSTVRKWMRQHGKTAGGSEGDEHVRTQSRGAHARGTPCGNAKSKRKEVRALRYCNNWMGWYDSIMAWRNSMRELYGLARISLPGLRSIDDKAARSSAGTQTCRGCTRDRKRMRFHTAASGL